MSKPILPDSIREERGQVGAAVSRVAPVTRDCLLIWVLLSTLYILLRTPFLIGDGVRWLPLTVAPEFPSESGGTRHYLFPFFSWSIYQVGSWLGLSNDVGPVRSDASAIVQGTNALLAAASVSIIYAWLRQSTTRAAALAGIAFAALGHAYLVHAANMTEPMASMVPTASAIWLLGRHPDRRAYRIGAGALVGVAAAFYLIASITVVPGALIVFLREGRRLPGGGLFQRLRSTAEFLAPAGVVYLGIIVSSEVLLMSTDGAHAALAQGFNFDLHGMYGRFHPKYLLGALFGLGNALCSFPPYQGLSRLLHIPRTSAVAVLAIGLGGIAFVFGLLLYVFRARRRLVADERWANAIAATAWLGVVYALAVYFLSVYEKIWIFAAFPLSCLVAIAADDFGREGHHTVRRYRTLWFAIPGVALLLGNVFGVAIPRRLQPNLDVVAAVDLANRLQPNDLVVCPGWDPISAHLLSTLRRPVACLSIIQGAMRVKFDAATLSSEVAARIDETHSKGGRVYFLALLELPAEEWQPFFGSQLKLPYEMLEPYRRRARLVERFVTRTYPESLFEIPPESK
jgi:hypothetical protein